MVGWSCCTGEKKAPTINSELWHACAGPLVSLPPAGSLVAYFPQGHSEQVKENPFLSSSDYYCVLMLVCSLDGSPPSIKFFLLQVLFFFSPQSLVFVGSFFCALRARLWLRLVAVIPNLLLRERYQGTDSILLCPIFVEWWCESC